MIASTLVRSLLALSLVVVAAGCGSSASDDGTTDDGTTDSASFAVVAPATGDFAKSSSSSTPISGYVFSNLGTTSITITDFEVDLADGKVIADHETGLVLEPGAGEITFSFDPSATHVVDKFSFRIEGTSEKLVVTTDDKTGHVPSTSTH